jgi:ParB family chromosome partitioning protein
VAKQALGRGLQALIPDSRLEELEQEAHFIPIEQISSYPGQPRKFFHQDRIEGLAQSISQHGIIQPLVVTRTPAGYQLIAGERRLRAAKAAGLKEIPAIITSVAEEKRLELSLIENIQREDLNPLEEAMAYNSMMEELGLTQEEVAQRVGKERSTIANTLRLLKLPAEIKQYLVDEQLSMGHARAILSLNNISQQLKACHHIIKKELSVRETERYIQQLLHPTPAKTPPQVDAATANLEERLKRRLSTQVKISRSKKARGKISIEFYSVEDLERITNLILQEGENP